MNSVLKKVFLLIMCLFCTSAFAQNVSNITATQEERKIIVSYDLDKEADILLFLSMDGGRTYQQLSRVSGDVGENIKAGHKTIVWDVLSERESLKGDNIIFKVQARNNQLLKLENADLTFNVKGVTFKMIYVKGGTFTMGATVEQGSDAYSDEKPTHRVTLSDFWIGETEVTQELWKAVMGNDPSYFIGDNLPIESVSWNDCQIFLSKLNQLTGKTYRLPTEAEWEYAARGGNKNQKYKYAGNNTINNVAWYFGNSSSETHPVKTKQANELGIYDMSGNVWEWCKDRYGAYSINSQTNPMGHPSCSYRVLRGGSWGSNDRYCRVSNRIELPPDSSNNGYGLRIVLVQ